MAGSLYECSFTLLMIFFIAICVAKLRFVEPSWTPSQPHNAAAVDCNCEQTPPPPVTTINCPPPMAPQPPESFPYPESSPPPPPPPDSYYPPTPGFSPPAIVYSSPPPPAAIVYSSPPPPPYVPSETPYDDIPSPPQQRPWYGFDHPLPGFQFASAECIVKSSLHIARAGLVTVIVLFFNG